jgi:hypothetical protein
MRIISTEWNRTRFVKGVRQRYGRLIKIESPFLFITCFHTYDFGTCSMIFNSLGVFMDVRLPSKQERQPPKMQFDGIVLPCSCNSMSCPR